MTWQVLLTVAVIVGVFAALSRNIAPDAVLMGGVLIVLLAGIITSEEAFSGFSNEGMLTVAALFIVAAALRETGALDTIGGWVLGHSGTERSALRRLSVSVTGISAFLNNTPIVAMFIPIITSWCHRNAVSPSRLLLPLSYLTILGGTCTLIGTSTNLVVQGLLNQATKGLPPEALANHPLRPMTLFELTPVGVPYAIIGVIFLFTVGYRLLPERKDFLEQLRQTAREYLVDLRIEPNCALVGRRVEDAGLRRLRGLFLIEIQRGDEIISPVTPDQLLEAGDLLTFTGAVSTIVDLERIPGLVPVADNEYESDPLQRRGRVLCEAVVSSTSPVLGKSIRDSGFRALYNAAVIAVHRGGERLQGRVGDIVLRPGDTLLLQTGAHFLSAHRNNPEFYLVSGIEDSRPIRHEKAALSIVLLVVLVTLMASGYVKIVTAAFLIAGLMVVTRCISMSVIRQTMDWQTLLTIGASFGLGHALENSGLVDVIAEGMVSRFKLLGDYGPLVCLTGIYIMTVVTTELITNNAAAVLMFPFAVAVAEQLGVSPRPFVLAVAFAASASFLTPIGYQTNLMVYGPGGYRFTDFVRVGLPLTVLLIICALILIPRVWPF
jgi:di/tricarboxylate transporter